MFFCMPIQNRKDEKSLEQKKKSEMSVKISFNCNLQNIKQFITISACSMLISGKRFL